MPLEKSEEVCWFSENILPHEPALKAWLCSRYPDADNIDDIIQDAYIKVLKVHENGVIRSPKSLLFRTAKNLSIDHLKSHKVSKKIPFEESAISFVSDTTQNVREKVNKNQRLEILKEAIQSLPNRCRQVITLHEVYGLSQKEIAKKLGISPSTVSDQVAIGIRKCTDYVRRYK